MGTEASTGLAHITSITAKVMCSLCLAHRRGFIFIIFFTPCQAITSTKDLSLVTGTWRGLDSPGRPATLWEPHSHLLWVAWVGEVGLPEASSHVGGGEWREAICVDLQVQRRQDGVVALVDAERGGQPNDACSDHDHAHCASLQEGRAEVCHHHHQPRRQHHHHLHHPLKAEKASDTAKAF